MEACFAAWPDSTLTEQLAGKFSNKPCNNREKKPEYQMEAFAHP